MTPEFPLTPRLLRAAEAEGVHPAQALPLAGDGSDRRFFRLPGKRSVILLYHPHPPGKGVTENDSYYCIGRHLRRSGVPVPEIYAYCRPEGWMLLEDVGDQTLAAAAARCPDPEQLAACYRQALGILVHQQLRGHQSFNPRWCFDTPALTRLFLWERECRYFLRAFVRDFMGLKVGEPELAPEFGYLVSRAAPERHAFFLHRDFQSKNLFVQEGRLRVLDFQGGRRGPLGYDLASLLIDPYVTLGEEVQEELLEYYHALLRRHLAYDRGEFESQYQHLALCRNLQILGAFAFLTRVKGKTHFAAYIPAALTGLRRRLQRHAAAFPRLLAVAEQACDQLDARLRTLGLAAP